MDFRKALMLEQRRNLPPTDQARNVATTEIKPKEVQVAAAENGLLRIPIQLDIKKDKDSASAPNTLVLELRMNLLQIDQGTLNVLTSENKPKEVQVAAQKGIVQIPNQLNIKKEDDDVNIKKEKDESVTGFGVRMKFRCKMCVVVCIGEEAWKAHVVGKKHQAKNRYVTYAAKGCYRCSYCDVECQSWSNFGNHLKGKKHLSNIQEVISC